MSLAGVLFYVLALIAVLGGVGVVISKEPVRSVLSLVGVMLALAGLFLMLSAQFVFAVQIIVYAGAVMVLFLFVVALLGPIREGPSGPLKLHWAYLVVVLAPLTIGLWALLNQIQFRKPDGLDITFFGTVEQIGYGLFTTYLYPFELTSILLLIAAVGAIYLSRGGRSAEEEREGVEGRSV
ncbi:MAG: NADH-quinone oxidoreductase subunit J [Candidatus Dormibacteraeota bacterium]|uniref:NADH-quinone oxidoreductase subunit J family protein n=1 Tax=Candidatus Dormibacter sp. TaxID=2973982 RepID=UPI00268EF589|nr:NADH-quinone oxidoreductase subunit J [Candidatus Dormibacteraeota bacterium]